MNIDQHSLPRFISFCIDQHDIVCNQKYGDKKMMPYSFHLDMVARQAKLFEELIPADDPYYSAVIAGCWGHDLIEDARVTYNDVKEMAGEIVADIVYCCTEEKGKNRAGRHSAKYFEELKQNDLAVFVKLCDIIANVKFSLLTNSGMLKKYRQEYPKVVEHLYREEYKRMFEYLEKLLNITK